MGKRLRMTKEEEGYFRHYLWSLKKYGTRDIDDAYGRYSSAKRSAWERIRDGNPKIYKMGLTVVATSCHFFSVGYVYQIDGEYHFVYHTAYNHYDVVLTDGEVREWKMAAYGRPE